MDSLVWTTLCFETQFIQPYIGKTLPPSMDAGIKSDNASKIGQIFCRRQRLKVIGYVWETNQSTNYFQEGHDGDPTLTARNTQETWTTSTFHFRPREVQGLDVNTRTHKVSVIQGSMQLRWPTIQVWPRLRAFPGHQTPWVGHPSGEVQVIRSTRTPGRQLALASV